MTGTPDEDSNPDAPDQDASANKVDGDGIDVAPTADKDPAEDKDEAGKD